MLDTRPAIIILSYSTYICFYFAKFTRHEEPNKSSAGKIELKIENMLKRPPTEAIPDLPGSYQFLDKSGKILYVGKAKSLKKRVNSYFSKKLDSKTMQMLKQSESIEWMSVPTEVDALMLEFNLIQEHRPRFNVRYRDDKSYPYLAITLKDEWPRPMVVRGKKKAGNRYFGPYGQAYAIRETLDLLVKTFPLRTCSDTKFKQHEKLKRPCLLFHIQKCSGPCAGEITPTEYSELVDETINFLTGNSTATTEKLSAEMAEHVERLDYEAAGRARDKIQNINKIMESQMIVGVRLEDFDVIGWEDQKLETAVQIFFVRNGRVMGRRGFILDKVESLNKSELMGRVLEGIYFEKNTLGAPKKVYVPELPVNIKLYEDWLSKMRNSEVKILIPQRGSKRKLAEVVTQNAVEGMLRHSLKRSTDYASRTRALNELQKYLGLPEAPLRIECYDTSHLAGTEYVGSMVVMEDGLPKKQDYRQFVLRDVVQNDDYSAMYELLKRRFLKYKSQVGQKKNSFSYAPSLLLVDGGKGQLSVARKVLRELELDKEIQTAALAKELEEVFVPGRKESIRLPRQSEALYLLQGIRDESHRVAVTHHRKRRSNSMLESFLDNVKGLGPARKKRLIDEMGGMAAISNANLKDLEAFKWLPNSVARAIYEQAATESISKQK